MKQANDVINSSKARSIYLFSRPQKRRHRLFLSHILFNQGALLVLSRFTLLFYQIYFFDTLHDVWPSLKRSAFTCALPFLWWRPVQSTSWFSFLGKSSFSKPCVKGSDASVIHAHAQCRVFRKRKAAVHIHAYYIGCVPSYIVTQKYS